MGFISFVLSDDAIIWRNCVKYSSLIRFDEWAGNDNNGFLWEEVEDESNGYIEELNGNGGIIDSSLLFTSKAENKY